MTASVPQFHLSVNYGKRVESTGIIFAIAGSNCKYPVTLTLTRFHGIGTILVTLPSKDP